MNLSVVRPQEPAAPLHRRTRGIKLQLPMDLRRALSREARKRGSTREAVLEEILLEHYTKHPEYLGFRAEPLEPRPTRNKTRWIPDLEPEHLVLKRDVVKPDRLGRMSLGKSASIYAGVYPNNGRWVVQIRDDEKKIRRYGSYESELDAARVATWAIWGLPFEDAPPKYFTPKQVRENRHQTIRDMRIKQIPKGEWLSIPKDIPYNSLIKRPEGRRGRRHASKYEGVYKSHDHWIAAFDEDDRRKVYGHYRTELDAARVATSILIDRKRIEMQAFRD